MLEAVCSREAACSSVRCEKIGVARCKLLRRARNRLARLLDATDDLPQLRNRGVHGIGEHTDLVLPHDVKMHTLIASREGTSAFHDMVERTEYRTCHHRRQHAGHDDGDQCANPQHAARRTPHAAA